MKIPNNKVGLVIGKGGETIKNMQARTGARIQVIPLHLPPGDTSRERTVQIDGTSEQIEAAKLLCRCACCCAPCCLCGCGLFGLVVVWEAVSLLLCCLGSCRVAAELLWWLLG
ncbi:hypothetical protein ACS0TY_033711 [Phlomoides rotata]